MTARIKQMTVQQLLDAGFSISLSKHQCGKNSELDAKQWLPQKDALLAKTKGVDAVVAGYSNHKLLVSFFA